MLGFYTFLVCLAFSPAFGSPTETKWQQMREIEFEELKHRLLELGDVILVDVRTAEELVTDGAIPGGINIPLLEVEAAFSMTDDDFKAKYGFNKSSEEIVISCRSGTRAQKAIEIIETIMPLKNFMIYRGSFLDWVANGGPIVFP